MTVTYNHERSYDERQKRFAELTNKQVTQWCSTRKYCVVTTRDGADGDYQDGFNNDHHYFTHRATAIAWAQHYSDMCDHVAGVFKVPEFICRVDVR